MDPDHKSLEELQERIRKFVKERNWEQYHQPINLAISASIELGELLELFQWKSNNEIDEALQDEAYTDAVASEIADVMIYLLRLSDRVGIHISDSILEKMKRNEVKYPADQWEGKAPNKLNRQDDGQV
jgi:NTP pyrophosphatase (non-canonical NTP hydrolase)